MQAYFCNKKNHGRLAVLKTVFVHPPSRWKMTLHLFEKKKKKKQLLIADYMAIWKLLSICIFLNHPNQIFNFHLENDSQSPTAARALCLLRISISR